MSLLLDDLLDVSCITQGTLSLRKQAVELSSVINAAVETARPHVDTRHHHLSIDVPDGLAAYIDPCGLANFRQPAHQRSEVHSGPGA